jgi:hypothetical protein
MDIIVAFIGWKRIRKSQTSVAHSKQVFVNALVMRMKGKLSLRRLGKRDAQEPSRATYADPSEGCIIEMCFRRGTTDLAESNAHIGCNLLLYYEGFKRRSEGEERLAGEQDNERAK